MMHNVTWEGQIAKLHEIADAVARGAYDANVAKGKATAAFNTLARIRNEQEAANDFTLYRA